MLKNFLKPIVPADTPLHVMTWVQSRANGAADIYWKTEIKMGQNKFDKLFQNLVTKGYGPVSLRVR